MSSLRQVAALLLSSSFLTIGCRLSEKGRETSASPLWLVPGTKRYFAVQNDEALAGVDLESGTASFRFELPRNPVPFMAGRERLVCRPIPVKSSLVLRTEDEVITVRARDGALENRASAERATQFGSRVCPAALDDGGASPADSYVTVTDRGTRLRRLRPDGTESWATDLPGGAVAVGPPRPLPSGRIVVRARDRLATFDDEGRLLWTRPLRDYEE